MCNFSLDSDWNLNDFFDVNYGFLLPESTSCRKYRWPSTVTCALNNLVGTRHFYPCTCYRGFEKTQTVHSRWPVVIQPVLNANVWLVLMFMSDLSNESYLRGMWPSEEWWGFMLQGLPLRSAFSACTSRSKQSGELHCYMWLYFGTNFVGDVHGGGPCFRSLF